MFFLHFFQIIPIRIYLNNCINYIFLELVVNKPGEMVETLDYSICPQGGVRFQCNGKTFISHILLI